jgi:hypothetical protein
MRLGLTKRSYLPHAFRLVAATALMVACSPVHPLKVARHGPVGPPELDVLQTLALAPGFPHAAWPIRGLRLIYDAHIPARATLSIARSIVRSNPRVDPLDALIMATAAFADARGEGLDGEFFAATILQESAFAPDALSSAGAVGIAQFTLDTADAEGIDPFDWRDALRGSARLLGRYVRAYDGTYADPYAAALAAYNAGPGAVDAYQGVPPYPETRDYISDIYDRWSRILRDETGIGALPQSPRRSKAEMLSSSAPSGTP